MGFGIQKLLMNFFSTAAAAAVFIGFFLLGQNAQANPYMNPGFWKQSVAGAPNLNFTNAAFSGIPTWTCSTMTVQTRNSSNVATNVVVDTTITLSGPTGSHFYSDSSCRVEISSVIVTSGTSSKTFYYMSGKQYAAATITAANVAYTSATQNENINSYLGCTWLGTTSNWGTAANWSCGHVPNTTVGDIAVFDSNCSQCTPATPIITQTPYGLWLTKDYSGTVNITYTGGTSMVVQAGGGCKIDSGTLQVSTQDFTCNGPFSQYGGTVTSTGVGPINLNYTGANEFVAGTFNPGNSPVNIAGDFTVSGGTFNSPTATTLTSSNSAKTFTLSGGTFTQGNTINLVGNFSMTGGTFVGGNAAFNTQAFTLSGGTFTDTSGIHTVKGNFTISGSPVFNSHAGTVNFYSDTTTLAITPHNEDFYNVTFNAYYGNFTLTGTLNVGGNLVLNDSMGNQGWGGNTITGGVIQVIGNVTATDYGIAGPTLVKLIGNPSGQTVTSATGVIPEGAALPTLEIATGTNPVTLSNFVSIRGGYTLTSVGTFNNTNTKLNIYSEGTNNFFPGAYSYKDVTLGGFYPIIDMAGQTLTVTGTFAMDMSDNYAPNDLLQNGFIVAYGNVTVDDVGFGFNTSLITLAGNASGQTVTGSGGTIPALTVAAGANAVTFAGTFTVDGNYTYTSSGTFTTTGNTLRLYRNGAVTNTTGNVRYNNVVLNGYAAEYDFNGSTMNVDGNFSFGDAHYFAHLINNGTFLVKGNVTASGYGNYGTGLIKLVGNASGQTISGIANAFFPNLEIAAGANPITLSGTVATGGMYKVTSMGTLTATGSTLNLNGQWTTTSQIWTGSEVYNNVTMSGDTVSFNLNGSSLNVGGSFSLNDANALGYAIDNGIIKLYGSMITTGYGKQGNAQLQFLGTNHTFSKTAVAQVPNGDVLVAISGTLTLSTNASWNAIGQTMNITSGAINMANKSLTLRNLTMSAGTSITRGTGTLKVNGVTIGAGPYGSGTIF